jgi:hypothetical protein
MVILFTVVQDILPYRIELAFPDILHFIMCVLILICGLFVYV